MKTFRVVPQVSIFNTFAEFAQDFGIGETDLIITNEDLYNKYIAPTGCAAHILYRRKYGAGEPTDEMIDAMARDLAAIDYKRLVAFGGGSTIDICKVLALDLPEKCVDVFQGVVPPKKSRELIIIPTTCGTGSEVTNVAIAELKSLKIKKGLAVEETFADHAVLLPEAINELPYQFFVTSSIDALIHAAESFLSPKATPFSEMYSRRAMEMIMAGYKVVAEEGPESRFPLLGDFLLASTYAGIGFSNAGCAAVHALSYSIGGAFHVPHGEANYQFFTEVFKTYMKKEPLGKIQQINKLFAEILDVPDGADVYTALETLLDKLIARKPLREYGMTEEQIDSFTLSTVENQQRLLANNYVFLTNEDIRTIFATLY